jgi:UDP-N-acetyl-D-galactosamine dehydrogenase
MIEIVIIGAGYVGLPLAISLSNFYRTTCYDIDFNRIKNLQKGLDTNSLHSNKELIKKNLIFTFDKNIIKNKNIYIITVPTPINKKNLPDLNMLKSASKMVGKCINKNSTIIFESTTFPGCTEEICIPIIEKNSKLKYKLDFGVGYSPERINPGDKKNTLKSITKIIAACNSKTLNILKNLYSKICKSVYLVKNITVAESAKVIENTQRDLNIALVNEFSIIFNKLKIPTNDVLKAAATKWNFHYYKPGLVGGHCISVDPYYLAYKANINNYVPKIILSGRKVNEKMGQYIAHKTIELLKANYQKSKALTVAILGFSFKENIPDFRNTKIIQIYRELIANKIDAKVFDSLPDKNLVKEHYKIQLYSFADIKKFKFDAIILAVSHKNFLKKLSFYDKFYINKNKKIFIDVKNNFKRSDFEKKNYIFFQL